MPKTFKVIGFVYKDGDGVSRNMDISDYVYDYDLMYDDFMEYYLLGRVLKVKLLTGTGEVLELEVKDEN